MVEDVGNGVGPAPRVDLGVDIGDVALYCPDTQDQLFGDLAVAFAVSDELQDLYLPRGQTVRVSWGFLGA